MLNVFKNFFSNRSIAPLETLVSEINALEGEIQALSDDGLKARTDMFRKQLADGADLDSVADEHIRVGRTAERAGSVQSSLRTEQHLDALNVVHGEVNVERNVAQVRRDDVAADRSK